MNINTSMKKDYEIHGRALVTGEEKKSWLF